MAAMGLEDKIANLNALLSSGGDVGKAVRAVAGQPKIK